MIFSLVQDVMYPPRLQVEWVDNVDELNDRTESASDGRDADKQWSAFLGAVDNSTPHVPERAERHNPDFDRSHKRLDLCDSVVRSFTVHRVFFVPRVPFRVDALYEHINFFELYILRCEARVYIRIMLI
jgi:hypothetical protein